MAPPDGVVVAGCLVPRSGPWRPGTLADVGTVLQATRFSPKPAEQRNTVWELAPEQGDGGSVGKDFRRAVLPDSLCHERSHTLNLGPRKARNNAKRREKRLISSKNGMNTLPHPPSFNEHLASVESPPLFMNPLRTTLRTTPRSARYIASRTMARWMVGRQQEVAQNLKGQRNKEALGVYKQNVEAKLDHGRLREVLLLNRPACNLELRYLENYSSVLRDCPTVIAANTRAPSKPYYHMGLALLALEQPDDALDARAWRVAADDVEFKTLRVRQRSGQGWHGWRRREGNARAAQPRVRWMNVAFVEHNLISVLNAEGKEGGSANPTYVTVRFDPEHSMGGTLIVPCSSLR
ncbi:hypothetical protein BJV78DRAFT_1351952 [Lactifluus subvellereus]|nr:hypothetical protein BJV78DRAFT_1351952 [Lactifluus subvellereus]